MTSGLPIRFLIKLMFVRLVVGVLPYVEAQLVQLAPTCPSVRMLASWPGCSL